MKTHNYKTVIQWTGNKGPGTSSYQSYSRNHIIKVAGKYDEIKASSDPSFRGDEQRFNPEELFLSSLSSCHMLWYLHLCSANNIVVTDYLDNATGSMEENENGSGKFTEVTLNPRVTVTDPNMIELAEKLHAEANKMCFIANSCNFEVQHFPSIQSA